jgi:serine/threonine protein kinase
MARPSLDPSPAPSLGPGSLLGTGANDTRSEAEQSVAAPGLYAGITARAVEVSKRRALPRLQCQKCQIVYSGALPKDNRCMECKGPLIDADPVPATSALRQTDAVHDTTGPAAARPMVGSPLLWAPGSSKRSEILVTRYMIKDPTTDILGSGAKGVVYKAYDRRMGNRPVAIKLFFDDGVEDPETKREQQRTEREIRIQALLTHPAIVTAHDRFESPHGSGIVLEYIDGESLEERVKKQGALAVRDAVRVALGVCKAVEFMHSKGIIHRDLKPANVLMTKDGNVKIIDFGVAKQKDDEATAKRDARDSKQVAVAHGFPQDSGALTREGTIVGTPSYMSPEQALGRVAFVDERSDIYGVGAILYYALTGKPPFVGDDVEAILDRVRKLPPPPPTTWNDKVDPEVEAIVHRTLNKLPEHRFANAGELTEQLRRFLDGEQLSTDVYLEPLSRRALRQISENRVLVLAFLGAIVAAVLVFATSYWAKQVQARESVEERLASAGKALQDLDVTTAIAIYGEVQKADRGNEEAARGLQAAYKAQVHVNLLKEGKDQLERARRAQENGEDPEPFFEQAFFRLRDAKFYGSPSPELDGLLKRSRGIARLDVARPEGAPEDASLRLVALSANDLSEERLAIDPPPRLPVAGLLLPTGLYQASIVVANDRAPPIYFPVKIARGSDLSIEAIPKAPPGMVYVRGHAFFRPGHPRHDDLPQQAVDPFFMDEREVSVGEYREFLASIADPVVRKRRTPSHWTDAAAPEPAQLPVTNVTLDDALAYAAFRGKDIPSEAQWQLAASGGLDDRDYPYGRRFVASYGCTSGTRPDPIGTHQHDRSPCGALDMGGNVSELVRGFFDAEGTKRLAKGGSFAMKAPVWERIPVTGPDRTIGFRCSKTLR